TRRSPSLVEVVPAGTPARRGLRVSGRAGTVPDSRQIRRRGQAAGLPNLSLRLSPGGKKGGGELEGQLPVGGGPSRQKRRLARARPESAGAARRSRLGGRYGTP